MSSTQWLSFKDGQPVHAVEITNELPQQQDRLPSPGSLASRSCSRAADCRSTITAECVADAACGIHAFLLNGQRYHQ